MLSIFRHPLADAQGREKEEGVEPVVKEDVAEVLRRRFFTPIGYPAGLPAKAAYGPETKVFHTGAVWIKTNLDAFGGNSGSAVFDLQGRVVGILVRGNQDYKVHENTCFFSNRLAESESGEMLTSTSVFKNAIPTGEPTPAEPEP